MHIGHSTLILVNKIKANITDVKHASSDSIKTMVFMPIRANKSIAVYRSMPTIELDMPNTDPYGLRIGFEHEMRSERSHDGLYVLLGFLILYSRLYA